LGSVAFLYGLFLVCLLVTQLALTPGLDCTDGAENAKIWNSCRIKVPYCQHIFVPRCDCADLFIEGHNWTSVPQRIGDMTALRKLTVQHGPLKDPQGLNGLFRLRELRLGYNNLSIVPEAVGELDLIWLCLNNNNLGTLPLFVWDHRTILNLEMQNNNIAEFPETFSENLYYLHLSNNSISELPRQIGKLNRAILLHLDGNKLSSVPRGIGDLSSVISLRLSNNLHIDQLPKEIGYLQHVEALDLRNTSLSALPGTVADMPSLKYLYVYGNPLCENGWLGKMKANMGEKRYAKLQALIDGETVGCSKQCSPYFQDRLFARQKCYDPCNQDSCNYCDGVC
jgi:hypothetical protein